MALGMCNTCRICRRQSSGAKALIVLFYIFSLFAMLSSCFSLVWYIIDPSLKHDSDDPHILPYIQAILAPAYWGLFMTVLLSMHQLGIALQVVLGEIDKKGMKQR